MNKAVEESIGNKRNVAKYVGIQKTDDHIFCAEDAGESTFLLNPHSKVRLMVKSIVTNKRWDYLTTFKPSRYLSIEAGKKLFEIEDVPPGSTEPNNGPLDEEFMAEIEKRKSATTMDELFD